MMVSILMRRILWNASDAGCRPASLIHVQPSTAKTIEHTQANARTCIRRMWHRGCDGRELAADSRSLSMT